MNIRDYPVLYLDKNIDFITVIHFAKISRTGNMRNQLQAKLIHAKLIPCWNIHVLLILIISHQNI